jgi:hypothetical protein
MKPAKKVQGWGCAMCGSMFTTKHKAGKRMAEECCTCSVEGCGKPTGRYIGGRGECEYHLAERDLGRAMESAVHADEWLQKAGRRFDEVKRRSPQATDTKEK